MAYRGNNRGRKKMLRRKRRKLQRPQPITMNSPIIKSNPFSDSMESKLKAHTQCHIDGGNPQEAAVRHEQVMRELMKRGATFEASHFVAQKQVPMKNQCR